MDGTTTALQRRPLVMAHQGLAGPGAPENSLAAMRNALDAGADSLEIDVHRTRDGVFVISHDARLADGRTIADLDAAQINAPGTPRDQGVPLLQDVLDLVRDRGARVMVELKERGYERALVDSVSATLPLDRFTMMAFSTFAVRAVEQYRPEVNTGIISPRLVHPKMREHALWPSVWSVLDRFDWPLRRVAFAGADALIINQSLVTDRMLASAAERGVDVDVWTVDSRPMLDRFATDTRVHGVITNHADVAVGIQRAAMARRGTFAA